ncbi:hypothetical protein I203_103011 [Kwoniella mangroviensis CBS 8507]|uniref:uncharacterized protein n=1 Tax=Kwoniella mangroviensis CBS 8507 TaxID=1296122 RepID=UPI00080D061F|nr:uncharacterized protein I203_03988 [Kwoniella mangroviensis CBS 8507]OCF67298.1 hypothetical protein I203_03988 [Kwoniella mangroviensis CBS 8507]
MPRPPETPDVRASKGLAYILRHGAEKEGLNIRSDGYIKLDDVLARPKMRDVDVNMVLRLVAENAKQRFQLFYGYDPSPPRPKKMKKGQQPKKQRPPPPQVVTAASTDSHNIEKTRKLDEEGDGLSPIPLQDANGIDAAEIDNIQSNLSKTTISSRGENGIGYVELPLVSLPNPNESNGTGEAGSSSSSSIKGEYFIRATQGHSIKLEGTSHLEELLDDEEGRKKAGVMVHGTRLELWDILKTQGLSKMSRQHIHLAPSHHGSIVPRPNSTLYLYLSLSKLIENNIPVYVSANGVVLTPGDEKGIVPKELWRKVVKVQKSKEKDENGKYRTSRVVIWEDGEIVDEREEAEGEEGI